VWSADFGSIAGDKYSRRGDKEGEGLGKETSNQGPKKSADLMAPSRWNRQDSTGGFGPSEG